ncbi:MAG TPA: hypothetical protein VH413_12455 [Verrucomicrobiae bacterium]|jgi:hypothetical protein|nr:hypothetical protein [Verrucomicrobiae bacterium]
MNARSLWLLIASSILLAGCGTTSERTHPNSPIAITIPYGSLDSPGSYLPGSRHSNNFYVLLTNVSDQPVRLWTEWCSWGYFSLQFEVTEKNGTVHVLKKKWINFYVNFPDYDSLKPNQSMVWNIELSSQEWEDLSWLPKDGGAAVKLKVIYQVNADDDSDEHTIWTGREVSDAYDFTLSGLYDSQPNKQKTQP